MYAVGIDGGGTNTRAILVGEAGQVLGLGYAGPSNYNDVGFETAKSNIKKATNAALNKAGLNQADIELSLFLGLAGVVSEKDRTTIHRMIKEIGVLTPQSTYVDHDVRIALAGALNMEEGICLIAGTGSSCYGRRKDGKSWRAGGWGALLDDAGGAYQIGLSALKAATQEFDGRGPATTITPKIMSALGIVNPDEIMHRVYVEGLCKREIAAFAPLVTKDAEAGDPVAYQILQEGALALAQMAQAVRERLNFQANIQIAVAGSVYKYSCLYRKTLTQAIKSKIPEAQITEPKLPPLLGAALLAFDTADYKLSDKAKTTLISSFSKWENQPCN